MNTPTVPPLPPAPEPDPNRFRAERLIAIGTSVVVVAAVLFLLYRNEPFADGNLVIALRIILSLAVGVIGATIPGFLHVEYNGPGFAIRAGGALALFVLTLYSSPKVESLKLASASLQLDAIRQVDMRSALGPEATADDRLNAEVLVTVPVSLRSVAEPAAHAILDATELSFVDAAGQVHAFNWRNFVTMHEERYGVWLGIDGDARATSIPAGEVFYREVLHAPATQMLWREALTMIESAKPEVLKLTLKARVGAQTLEQVCNVDMRYWGKQVAEFRQKGAETPGRVTMSCIAG